MRVEEHRGSPINVAQTVPVGLGSRHEMASVTEADDLAVVEVVVLAEFRDTP